MFKTMETRWELELPGEPQQIWDGFTRHAAAYLWPITYEPRVGGAERGLTSDGGTVTVWDPPRHFRTEATGPDGWFNTLDYRLDGSHLTYVAEFLAGDIVSVSGGRFSTAIAERPKALGAVMGHDHVEVSDEYEAVENDDYAAYSAEFANGVGGLEVSRVAAGHANSLIFEVFCENGAASFDQRRPSEIQLFLREGKSAQAGYRQIILGPEHPYLSGGLAMDAPSVGFGQNDAFAYQARAFLEEVAGIDEASSLPRCATFDEGVHNMELLAAVAESAAHSGRTVEIPAQK